MNGSFVTVDLGLEGLSVKIMLKLLLLKKQCTCDGLQYAGPPAWVCKFTCTLAYIELHVSRLQQILTHCTCEAKLILITCSTPTTVI